MEERANVTLTLSVNGQIFHRDRVTLAANETTSATDDFTSPAADLLQAEISPSDELDADNRAQIDLPSSQPVSVAVLTARTASSPNCEWCSHRIPACRKLYEPGRRPKADVIIYDGPVPAGGSRGEFHFNSAAVPRGSSSPHRVRLANWNAEHPAAPPCGFNRAM